MDGSFRRIDFKIAVRLKEILVLEFHNILEHGAILHMMAVDWIVPAAEVRLAVGIQINGPVHAVLALKILM